MHKLFAWYPASIARYRALTTEQKAGWITAFSTAIQTIAVCGALFVAFIEWRGHKAEDQLRKREATQKLFVEQPDSVAKARQIADTGARCGISKKDPPGTDMFKLLWCNISQLFAPDHPTEADKDIFYQQTQSLREYLKRVDLCVNSDICDAELSKKLFCTDATNLVKADSTANPNDGRALPTVPFSKACKDYVLPKDD